MDDDSFINSFNENEKQLMLSEAGETDLVLREIIGTVVEGAKSRESARKVLPIINTASNTCRVTYGASPSGQYSGYTAEGATIPIDSIRFSSTNITVQKAAIRVPITKELIEDAQFDVIELELKKAGAKLENQLNREAINTMLNGISGPDDIDPNGTHIGTYDIGVAKGEVDENGWTADTLLLHPQALGWLIDETNIGDITDGNNKVIGLDTHILDATTNGISGSSDNYAFWDNTDSGYHYYGLVFDSKNYAVIVMRDDISTSKIEDPVNDLTDLIIKMRFGVGVLNKDAACRILTK
jgi:hypothetical protein